MDSSNVLLITGPPGIGKTTVIRTVAQLLEDCPLQGFFTRELRVGGRRMGFEVETFDGHRSVLAHRSTGSPYRVGPYGVDLPSFEQILALAFPRPGSAGITIIDEIGRMECCSTIFMSIVEALLDDARPLVATVSMHGLGFIGKVKAHPGAELWTLSTSDRGQMATRILQWLTERTGS